MTKSVISEGKTTNEAIENGLKELKVSKKNVDIRVIESEEKRSFFSILAPRVVKVELTVKEDNETPEIKENKERKPKKEIKLSEDEQEKAKDNLQLFLEEFIKNLPETTEYNIKKGENYINVSLNGKDLGYLIGYRGETLYALQSILSAIAGKEIQNKVRVILDIQGYKEKREKTLEELAEKVAKTVVRTKKSVKLEPMKAYERKIIHSKLQQHPRVETTSVGEEPYRRIIVSLKSK